MPGTISAVVFISYVFLGIINWLQKRFAPQATVIDKIQDKLGANHGKEQTKQHGVHLRHDCDLDQTISRGTTPRNGHSVDCAGVCSGSHWHRCHDTVKLHRARLQSTTKTDRVFEANGECPSMSDNQGEGGAEPPEMSSHMDGALEEFSFNMLFEPEEYGLETALPLLQSEVRRRHRGQRSGNEPPPVGLQPVGLQPRHGPRVHGHHVYLPQEIRRTKRYAEGLDDAQRWSE